MILEATDIENWGSKHQLILTSHYALIHLEEEALLKFFKKLRTIQISGIIFKVSRLVEEVPIRLIQHCNTFDIPLIEIPNDVKYESILLAVFQPIINENSKLLNAYYHARKTINQLSMKDLTLDDLMETFKSLLKRDVQFESESQSTFYSTLKKARPYRVIDSQPLPKLKFIDNLFYAKVIALDNGKNTHVTSVEIPNILEQPYFFTIFEKFENLTETDLMLIENVTELLLTELLKIYALKKSRSLRKNNQMHDLLLARYYSVDEKETLLNTLNIDKYPFYQGVIVSLYGGKLNDNHPFRSPLDGVIDYVRTTFKDFAYFQKNDDVVFLFNLESETDGLIDQDFTGVIEMYKQINSEWLCHVGISSIQDDSLTQINDTLLDLKNLMKVIHPRSTVLEHDKLGFLKMFYKIDSIQELYGYVPKSLHKLIEEKPEYAITFARFLENQHHYVKTAEALYVHPKTVRYRIARVLERLNIELDDSETLLAMQVALKICEYTGLLKS